MSQELTHLDVSCFNNDNLPPELFVNFAKWIEPVIKDIKKNAILNTGSNSKLRCVQAETSYFLSDATAKKIDVNVIDFDPITAKFLVENDTLKVKTWRSRLFMRIKNEPDGKISK